MDEGPGGRVLVVAVALVLLAVLGGCGNAGAPGPQQTTAKNPRTLGAACSYGHIPDRLHVSRVNAPRGQTLPKIRQNVRNRTVVRQLKSTVCGLPKAQQTSGCPAKGQMAYHLVFSSYQKQTMAVTVHTTGCRWLFLDDRVTQATAHKTNQKFWNELARALNVPKQKLFSKTS